MDFAESYFDKLFDEQAFIGSRRKEVSASGGTFNLHLKNPADSGKIFLVDSINVQTQGAAEVTIYDSFSSAPSGGNDVMIDNMLLGSDNTSPDTGVGEVNSDVSFTATSDGEHSEHTSGSGQGLQQSGGTSSTAFLCISDGREIVIQVTNNTASAYDAAISVVYFQSSSDV